MRYVFLILCVLVLSRVSWSHPAQSVKAEYDSVKKELRVIAEHTVQKPNDHYINKIEVFVDGEIVITQTFKSQKDGLAQDVLYTLFDVKSGSKIKVSTVCNKSGIKSTEIIVK